VHRLLSGGGVISEIEKYTSIVDMTSVNLLPEIATRSYDLTVLEVERYSLSRTSLGDGIHRILMEKACDVLLI